MRGTKHNSKALEETLFRVIRMTIPPLRAIPEHPLEKTKMKKISSNGPTHPIHFLILQFFLCMRRLHLDICQWHNEILICHPCAGQLAFRKNTDQFPSREGVCATLIGPLKQRCIFVRGRNWNRLHMTEKPANGERKIRWSITNRTGLGLCAMITMASTKLT